jgi:hypothetical protein
MIKKISVPYFHVGLKYTTPLIFGAGVYLISIGYRAWGVIVILVGLIILSTKYVTEFNLKGKYIKDYVSFLGLELDEELKRVERLDRIVVTKGNYSQMINTRSRSHQLDWVDYTGTLIFDDGEVTLLTKNEKHDLLKGLKEFAEFLQVGVEDRTTHQFFWIDLTKF